LPSPRRERAPVRGAFIAYSPRAHRDPTAPGRARGRRSRRPLGQDRRPQGRAPPRALAREHRAPVAQEHRAAGQPGAERDPGRPGSRAGSALDGRLRFRSGGSLALDSRRALVALRECRSLIVGGWRRSAPCRQRTTRSRVAPVRGSEILRARATAHPGASDRALGCTSLAPSFAPCSRRALEFFARRIRDNLVEQAHVSATFSVR
jgi:hypothetical protein